MWFLYFSKVFGRVLVFYLLWLSYCGCLLLVMVIFCKLSFVILGLFLLCFFVFLIFGFIVFVCLVWVKYNLKDVDSSWDISFVGVYVYMLVLCCCLDLWELVSCGESDFLWFVSLSRVCVDVIFVGVRLLRWVCGFFGLILCWGMFYVCLGV